MRELSPPPRGFNLALVDIGALPALFQQEDKP
jgi:hypothetical protein